MFSPFHDRQGMPKELADVEYADLAQLADYDEGFALEFKQSFSPSVRRKVPKVVASFANSRGGWLVIGISDAEKGVCPIPRPKADVSQIIGELCRRHVSPAPRFDARFVANPVAPEQGVILVQVFEGDFPPYVADGVVEIREGSTSGPAAGTALVDLYDKATRRRLEVRMFCKRTVHYPMGGDGLPLFNLYLFRMGRMTGDSFSREKDGEHARAMRRAFERQGLDCRVQHAHDSLVFRIPARDETVVPHSAIELFPDESIKLSVPAVLLDGEDRDSALDVLASRALFPPAVDAQLIDAPATLGRVTRMASLLDRYARARGIAWREYAVAYELENMAGVTLWSDNEAYLTYAERHGVLYCATTDCLSRVRYLDDGAHDTFRARQFAGSHFFEACGLPLGSPDPEDNALVDALLRTS